eukprot:TRINITY_DN4222_c0_g1_i1.p1 TRINITY_DN4222_c0_g1~~TRINITY_DN4222_c0_g1_i1.p1  ORF type:complete len:184 (-),score=80.06 TRINITY_DN4222_c0_g1_i1:309-860(-)
MNGFPRTFAEPSAMQIDSSMKENVVSTHVGPQKSFVSSAPTTRKALGDLSNGRIMNRGVETQQKSGLSSKNSFALAPKVVSKKIPSVVDAPEKTNTRLSERNRYILDQPKELKYDAKKFAAPLPILPTSSSLGSRSYSVRSSYLDEDTLLNDDLSISQTDIDDIFPDESCTPSMEDDLELPEL